MCKDSEAGGNFQELQEGGYVYSWKVKGEPEGELPRKGNEVAEADGARSCRTSEAT